MKRDKYWHFIFLILFTSFHYNCKNLSSNNQSENEKKIVNKDAVIIDDNNYPEIIIEKGLYKWYDETKWYLYLSYCLDTPTINDGYKFEKIKNKSFSSFPIALDSLTISNDSFSFYFYDEQLSRPISPVQYPGLLYGVNGMMFTNHKNIDSSLCLIDRYSSLRLICFPFNKLFYDTISFRQINPLQLDVIEFINKNQKDLNPWFVNEAKKRGVIK